MSESTPDLIVSCGGAEHHVRMTRGATGFFDFELLNHSSGFDVVVALGGKPSACHNIVQEIRDTAFRFQMSMRVVYEWYAFGFSHTNMLAWGRYCGPQVAQLWQDLGVNAAQLRRLSAMDMAEPLTPETFADWKQACTYGRKIDLAVIEEYISNDVRTGAEALAWRRAGLSGPNQLRTLRKRGVGTPEKLAKRIATNRELATIG